MPIDNVPLESAIKFVRGSHNWDKWFHPKKFETEKNYQTTLLNYEDDKQFDEIPDIDGQPDKYELLTL